MVAVPVPASATTTSRPATGWGASRAPGARVTRASATDRWPEFAAIDGDPTSSWLVIPMVPPAEYAVAALSRDWRYADSGCASLKTRTIAGVAVRLATATAKSSATGNESPAVIVIG